MKCKTCRGHGVMRYFVKSGKVVPVDKRQKIWTQLLLAVHAMRPIKCVDCDGTGEIEVDKDADKR